MRAGKHNLSFYSLSGFFLIIPIIAQKQGGFMGTCEDLKIITAIHSTYTIDILILLTGGDECLPCYGAV